MIIYIFFGFIAKFFHMSENKPSHFDLSPGRKHNAYQIKFVSDNIGKNRAVYEFKNNTSIIGTHFVSDNIVDTEIIVSKFKENLYLLFILNHLTSNMVSTPTKLHIIDNVDFLNEKRYTPNLNAGNLLDEWNFEL